MGTLQSILSILAGLLVLIVAAASAVAFFRVNLAKNQIEALRGDRDDLSKRVDNLNDLIDEYKVSKVAQDVLIREQAEKIKTLEKVVTGKEQLDHIERFLENHDRRVDERHDTLSRNIGKLSGDMLSVRESLDTLHESNQEMQAAMLLVLQGGKSNG